MVKVQNLTCRYQKRVILENLSFEIAQNEIFSLLGANGSGKSTLLKAIMGLIDYEGEIFIDGKNTKNIKKSEMAKYIAYVPQSSSIAFDFSVFDIVLMGRFHSSKLHINYSNNDKKIALEALEKIGILEFKGPNKNNKTIKRQSNRRHEQNNPNTSSGGRLPGQIGRAHV